jgi:hypothetical protein
MSMEQIRVHTNTEMSSNESRKGDSDRTLASSSGELVTVLLSSCDATLAPPGDG